ncbi:MAG: DoxX family protein, partial [Ardenticatenaceae bacterium]
MLNGLRQYSDLAPLILRLAIGIVFTLHGAQKYGLFGGGLDGAIQGFTGMGIPAPGVTAPFVGAVELFSGLALI